MVITNGYQTGNPADIARRYSSGGALASNLGQIQRQQARGFGLASMAPPRPSSPPKSTGVAGPTGPDDAGTNQMPAPDTGGNDQTAQNAAAFQDSPDGVAPPEGNATQRWQASAADSTSRYYTRIAGASQRGANRVQSLMARRIYAGSADVPTVDGSNNLRGSSDPNRPAAVQFNNSPSDWTAY